MNWIGLYTALRREVKRTFRVPIQTLVAPVISAALYIFIFGMGTYYILKLIGKRPQLLAVTDSDKDTYYAQSREKSAIAPDTKGSK